MDQGSRRTTIVDLLLNTISNRVSKDREEDTADTRVEVGIKAEEEEGTDTAASKDNKVEETRGILTTDTRTILARGTKAEEVLMEDTEDVSRLSRVAHFRLCSP